MVKFLQVLAAWRECAWPMVRAASVYVCLLRQFPFQPRLKCLASWLAEAAPANQNARGGSGA